MDDQLKHIRQKIENMKADAIESRKWYPKRYRSARQSKTTAIKTLNGVLKLFPPIDRETK